VREAQASCAVRCPPTVIRAIRAQSLAKGDVLAVARIAGIQAAKRTADLIPLCHPLALDRVSVDLRLGRDRVHIHALVRCTGRTGVEMEALTAAATAALTVYDMCKALDKGLVIIELRLDRKSGGKSGDYSRARSSGQSKSMNTRASAKSQRVAPKRSHNR
jgi:molybdenum cofactor biosynthesis protein MoaC